MQESGNPGAAWDQAMRAGDWRTAWVIADAVLAARDPAGCDDPALPYHLRWVWDGSPLTGRDVLVRSYHGLGDTLQFARYLPLLRARARRMTIEIQPELVPLLAGAADRVVAFEVSRPLPPAEVDIEIMELAHALRLPPDGLATPVLQPAATPTGAVGVCWQAGGWDPARSVPLSRLLAALCSGRHPHPGLRSLVSLQRGAAACDATSPLFLNPQDQDPDILRTAALILGAHTVVTVDTMVAHLAGALGAPTLLLLRHHADWRWGNAATTPWYPSLRLLRQHAPGDWSQPLAAVRRLVSG